MVCDAPRIARSHRFISGEEAGNVGTLLVVNGDELAEVVVIANGVRAGRAKPLPLAPTGQPATAHVAAAPS